MATAEPLSPVSMPEPSLEKIAQVPLVAAAPAAEPSVIDHSVQQANNADVVDQASKEPEGEQDKQADAGGNFRKTLTRSVNEKDAKIESTKMSHKEKQLMDRLGAAIDKAIAAGTAATGTSVVRETSEKRARWFINASFNSSDYYVIPWAACHSWNVSSSP